MTDASKKAAPGEEWGAQNAKQATAASVSSGSPSEASAGLLANSRALRKRIQPDWVEEDRPEPTKEEKALFAKQALWVKWLRHPEKLSQAERESVQAVSTTPEFLELEQQLLADEAETKDSMQKMFIRQLESLPDEIEFFNRFDFFRDALDGLADILAQQGWLEGEAREKLHAAIEKHSAGEDPWAFMRQRMPVAFATLEAAAIKKEVPGSKGAAPKQPNRL